DIEGYKTWLASLSLIDKAMLTKHFNKVLIADEEPTPEPTLTVVGAGDRLTIDGEIYGVDSVSSDVIKITILDDDREQFVITDQEDPFLSRAKRAGYVFKGFVTDDSINEIIENGIERAKALAMNNLKKSDYQANGTLTFDGQDKLVDILARKGFDNTKAITVGNINYVSLARCIVSKYNDALYQQTKATVPEPTPEPTQTVNTDGFKSTMADCLDNFKNGTVSLADTKKRIKSLLKNSPQTGGMLDRVNELLAQRAKAKFISAFNDVLDYEPEPVDTRTFSSVVEEYKSTLDEARELGFQVTVDGKDGVIISYPDNSKSVEGAEPDDLDILEDFLSSELPFMIENWQKGSKKREFELKANTLKQFVKGARLPDGWKLDKHDIESDDYDFARISIDTPLDDIVNDYGYYSLSVVGGGVTLLNGGGDYLAKDGSRNRGNAVTYESMKEVMKAAVKNFNDSEAFSLLDDESDVDEIIKDAENGSYSDAANKIILAYRDSKAPAPAPEDSAEVESAVATLNKVNDQEEISNPKADLDNVNAAVEVLKAAGVEYQYEGLIGDITDKLISALMNVVKGIGA
ncbi:hypothetical protein VXS06_14880, partial [Photobacterium toruni]|nr:hypothetical protein [Photobacterium toruni]